MMCSLSQGKIKLNNRLPIVKIFLEALYLPYTHYRVLLKVAMPLIVICLASLSFGYFYFDAYEIRSPWLFSGLVVIAFGLSLVVAVIGCHRVFLLDSELTGEPKLLNWTGNEVRYFGWWTLIGICAALVAVPFGIMFNSLMELSLGSGSENDARFPWVMGLANMILLYAAARLSLVLPSSAISIHGKSLAWSWRLSSGNGWRLALLVGFLPFMTDLAVDLIPTDDSIIFTLVYAVAWLLVGVIEVGLLSLSYKFLVSNEPSNNLVDEQIRGGLDG